MHLSLKLMGVARETEQWLRALAVDLGLGSSTHRQLTKRLLLQAQCPLLASVVRGIYMVHLHTYIQANTHTYKIKINTPLKLKIRDFRHGQLKRPTCSFEMFF